MKNRPPRKKQRVLSFIDRRSPVHALSGASKCVIFLLWSVLVMISFETRILCALTLTGAVLLRIAKVRFSEISFVIKMMLFFLILNLAAIYVFAPEQGVLIYKTRYVLIAGRGRWTLTLEQLFYELNVLLKYCAIIPPAILLMVTTHPSEFAASLNRIGVPYSIAYAVSLTLRYIPDVQRDYETISQAQQARGLEISRKAPPLKRLKGTAPLIMPLVFSSMERIDVISRAMELRGFGKHKKRTWYSSRPFCGADILALTISAALFAAGIALTFRHGSRFYRPF
ncbi:MAG: energy-coupling factor transporter transmembrane protein EcfT [Spirochaetaceae bacterium]|nr:energy-coupling factor transporter transmembrane protein EcfT [Spirochaetaceae bacterium]